MAEATPPTIVTPLTYGDAVAQADAAVDIRIRMAVAPVSNPSNTPSTCLWCGRRLRRPRHVLREHLGDYGDNAFCGLRCGYAFGVTFAGFGHRLQPREANQ